MKNKLINMPKSLWKLHGKQSYPLDIILTYLIAIIVIVVNLITASDLELWKLLILAILSLDIGGGVISNFTRGTINYYRETTLSPHQFIWVHILQTLAIAFIFAPIYLPILLSMLITMAGASIAILFHKTIFQLQISVFFFVLVVLLQSFFSEMPIPASILILLMSIKLLVGFSGHYGKTFNKS